MYGLVLLVIMMFMPEGIVGLLQGFMKREKSEKTG
jgi:ABC-type branched-subunit amino acid transport system permease subunit